ncbi:MAG: riboflavin synthase [Oligoflexia bacterium]|nr:riboflavin synthase [Oligoflexia bacterium]MBF0367299.1 riboflavin synthase [Oligoflexia bacterium]
MFTGIIEEIGEILEKKTTAEGQRLKILAPKLLAGKIFRAPLLSVDDSISISGVCQTITSLQHESFVVDSVHTTLAKSVLGSLEVGDKVHLESALTLQKPLGGHMVLGHVNGVGQISSYEDAGNNRTLWISITSPHQELFQFIVAEGSIALDGVSLTIAAVENHSNRFALSLIPHTLERTLFRYKNIGDKVNIEVDIMAKYAKQLRSPQTKLSFEWLKEQGF